MPVCWLVKQSNAHRVDRATAAKKSAADVFRHRHIDNLLKKALGKSYPQAVDKSGTDEPQNS